MIELAGPETARYVAEHLGPDEICVKEYGRENAAELCFETARDSTLSWVVVSRDGEPVCLFGADGDEGDSWGSAWMFSTENIGRAAKEVIQGARVAINYALENHWPELRIIAEDRTSKQTKFLELIGFRPSSDDPRELVI